MSKIALIASTLEPVTAWREATGLSEEFAPWIFVLSEIDQRGPFISVLCLADWRSRPLNSFIYTAIMATLTPTPVPTLESDDDGPTPVVGRPAPSIDAPLPHPQEAQLRAFGVSAAMIGMLGDASRNAICSCITGGRLRGAVAYLEEMARRNRLANWRHDPELENAAEREAGFLPDDSVPAVLSPGEYIATEPPAIAARRAPRPFVDPVRDHMRDYMRSAQRENSRARAERAERQRIRDRDERRMLDETRDPEPDE